MTGVKGQAGVENVGVVGVKNTDFYLPPGDGNVVGDNISNGRKKGVGKIYPPLPIMGVSIPFNRNG